MVARRSDERVLSELSDICLVALMKEITKGTVCTLQWASRVRGRRGSVSWAAAPQAEHWEAPEGTNIQTKTTWATSQCRSYGRTTSRHRSCRAAMVRAIALAPPTAFIGALLYTPGL